MSESEANEMPAHTFVIDLERCTGCWACAVACRMRNGLDEGEWWIRVETVGGAGRDTSSGSFPEVEKHYRPVIERCSETATSAETECPPPCAAACPTRAIEVDEPRDPTSSGASPADRQARYAGRVDEIDVWYRPARDASAQRRSGGG